MRPREKFLRRAFRDLNIPEHHKAGDMQMFIDRADWQLPLTARDCHFIILFFFQAIKTFP